MGRAAEILRSRWSTASGAFALGWAAIGASLLSRRHLPFQDLPNHVLLLRIDRALLDGHGSHFYRHPDITVLGYSLYVHLAHAAGHLLSPERSIQWLLVLSGLALPLAAARLARVAGGSGRWTAVLTLPLALSWPLRMGLVSYVLALPLSILVAGELIRSARQRAVGPVIALALCALLCYLAHPFVFALDLLLAVAAWYFVGERRAGAALRCAVGLLPALLLLLHDLRVKAFSQVAGTEQTWEPSPTYFRPILQSVAHTVTRSFGITDRTAALFYAPLLALLAALVVRRAAAAPGEIFTPSARRFLVAATVIGIAGSVLVPGSVGTTWVLGDRVAVIGVLFVCVLIAGEAARQSRAFQLGLLGAVALSLTGTLFEIARRAREVSAIVDSDPSGASPRLDGRYLTYRLSDCAVENESTLWGRYDPERHLWAEALTVDGATPYLFAFSRYLPVWYDGERYRSELAGPHEWTVNAWRPKGDRRACEDYDRRQIRLARQYPAFDGVIVTGSPERTARIFAGDELRPVEWHRLRPGLTLFRPLAGAP